MKNGSDRVSFGSKTGRDGSEMGSGRNWTGQAGLGGFWSSCARSVRDVRVAVWGVRDDRVGDRAKPVAAEDFRVAAEKS